MVLSGRVAELAAVRAPYEAALSILYETSTAIVVVIRKGKVKSLGFFCWFNLVGNYLI